MEVSVSKNVTMLNYMDWMVEENTQKYCKMYLHNHCTIFSVGTFDGQNSVSGLDIITKEPDKD